MPTTPDTTDFSLDIVDSKQVAKILKKARQRGSRASKYTPVYEAVAELGKGKFVVLRGVDKASKLGLYQGIKRNFDDEVKMVTAAEKDSASESYVVVIGSAADYERMRAHAKNA